MGSVLLGSVFYCCSSKKKKKKISSDSEFKDITFIAPNKDIGVTEQSGVVVADQIQVKDKNGDVKWYISTDGKIGLWTTCRNGRYTNAQYPGNNGLKPGTKYFVYK